MTNPRSWTIQWRPALPGPRRSYMSAPVLASRCGLRMLDRDVVCLGQRPTE